MRQTSSHRGRSRLEREYYSKALKNMDYEPTVDETLKFPETDDRNRDFSIQKSQKKRKPEFKQLIIDHFEENWIKWLLGGIALIIGYLMIDSKIDIAGIRTKVESIKEDVSVLKNADKENREKIHQQELRIQENKIRLDSLQSKKDR